MMFFFFFFLTGTMQKIYSQYTECDTTANSTTRIFSVSSCNQGNKYIQTS